jgi:hypothetical protein
LIGSEEDLGYFNKPLLKELGIELLAPAEWDIASIELHCGIH